MVAPMLAPVVQKRGFRVGGGVAVRQLVRRRGAARRDGAIKRFIVSRKLAWRWRAQSVVASTAAIGSIFALASTM